MSVSIPLPLKAERHSTESCIDRDFNLPSTLPLLVPPILFFQL